MFTIVFYGFECNCINVFASKKAKERNMRYGKLKCFLNV